MIRYLLLCVCVPIFAHAKERDEQALLKAVAETLGYPIERLTLTNRTEQFAKKTAGQVVLAYQITSADNTFAPLSIAVAKRGAILTPALESECQAAIRNNPPKAHVSVEKIALLGDAYGYTGLGAAGPGGSEERFVVAWPSRGIDMQIKLVLSRDSPLAVDAATESYRHLLYEGEEAELGAKILKAMRHIMAHIELEGIKFASATTSTRQQSTLPMVEKQSHSEVTTTPLTIEERSLVASDVADLSTTWSIIVILIVVASALLWLLVKKRN